MRLSPAPMHFTAIRFFLIVISLFFCTHAARATTYYVNASNSVPVAPYTSWTTAATNIQDAIAMTVNGDTVLVTNGVYAYGGAVMDGALTSRIAVTNAITVQSVNGPGVTEIMGGFFMSGRPLVRCAWLTNGVSLNGFTLFGGDALGGNLSGGGAWCASTNAYINNCIVVSNFANQFGAGVYQGTLASSLVRGNTGSSSFGTVYQAVLNNCTVISNNAVGVVGPLAMTNCLIYFNNNQNFNTSGNGFSHCCTTPALAGTGNFTTAPTFFVDGVHPANNSSCAGTGVYIGGSTDIFGNTYLNPPSVGCAELASTALVTAPKITLTSNPVGFSVGNFVLSAVTPYSFNWLENGQPLTDNGHFSGTQTTNLMAAGVSLADAGNYQVIVNNSFGAVTSAVVTLTVHCVNGAGVNPVAPYTAWATAATNIQDAITASANGDVVLVTNGLYNSGGKSIDGVITNRVSIDKAILVQSVNGAAATVIQGAWDPATMTGAGAVRCVWMTTNAILVGFTVSGGATRGPNGGSFSVDGGGIFGTSNSVIYNCILSTNFASGFGGGAFSVTAIGCTFTKNQAWSAQPGGSDSGGGAYNCNLQNCELLNNFANQGYAGGAYFCNLKNCALIGNAAYLDGGAAYGGTLINCTVVSNISSIYTPGYGSAVSSAILNNCIVINNLSISHYPNTNYANCTLTYCCADPLPSGAGNIDVSPQVLADGFHLAQTSPCIGAGTATGISGTDIDGQAWKNPPSMGCDEWYPQPVMAIQPGFQVGFPPHDLTWSAAVAGQTPYSYFWAVNGVPILDDGHHSSSSTANMVINNFGPGDAGVYQLVVTNASGSVTSAPVQLVIHAVDAFGANPAPPYTTWANAATNIQDAINVAGSGDIVLVTNGTYSYGGLAAKGLTNRIMLNQALTVISVNGYNNTVIQGARDPIATNGPSAVRCAWVGSGAVLNGFTLENGATLAGGDGFQFGPMESGGGVWCNASNAIVSNCILTNNSAHYGGGVAYGTVNNSLIVGNQATYGGGTAYSFLNNCTVANNLANGPYVGTRLGGGAYSAIVRNSIVVGNKDYPFGPDDYYSPSYSDYAYSCAQAGSPSVPLFAGNITSFTVPTFVDWFHLSTMSPCDGGGSAAYARGYDIDGQPWNNPPSMGCSEVISSNLVGPLSVNFWADFTNVVTGHVDFMHEMFRGRVAYLSWSFGDGFIYTNNVNTGAHAWNSPGNYPVTFTAYNNDNPNGVSTGFVVFVQSPLAAQIQSPALSTNNFWFQFTGQINANYIIQYATNLTPPISWQGLEAIQLNTQAVIQVFDPSLTNAARFYRVLTQ